MDLELKTEQDIIDFTIGCCFFGTGGGGDPLFGQQILREALESRKSIRIVDGNKLKDNPYTICPFLMGSSGPVTAELQRAQTYYGLTKKTISNMSKEAASSLLKHSGVKLGAVVPIEIGGAATASAVATAAWLGVPVVDGDYAGGRALPEISQFLPAIHGLSYSPLYSVDAFNNQVCIFQATNSRMEERIGKLIAGASFGLAGQAALLRPYQEIESCIVRGTLTRAFMLGKAIRESKEKGEDIIIAIKNAANAKLILKGKIIGNKAEEKDNYYLGEQYIEGKDEYASLTAKIWFKNEYLQLWLNDKPFVTSPDFICVVSYPEGRPMINNQIKIGDEVAVFAVKAPEILTSQSALEFLGPRYFGFNFDYLN